MNKEALDNYYKNCAYPKPVDKKKKKKKNGWKNKKNRICAYCGERFAERHEVFWGSNRQTSIDLGFQVDVCRAHHEELHQNSTAWAKSENLRLRQHFQREYEEKLILNGISEEQARKIWIAMIGRNYL